LLKEKNMVDVKRDVVSNFQSVNNLINFFIMSAFLSALFLCDKKL